MLTVRGRPVTWRVDSLFPKLLAVVHRRTIQRQRLIPALLFAAAMLASVAQAGPPRSGATGVTVGWRAITGPEISAGLLLAVDDANAFRVDIGVAPLTPIASLRYDNRAGGIVASFMKSDSEARVDLRGATEWNLGDSARLSMSLDVNATDEGRELWRGHYAGRHAPWQHADLSLGWSDSGIAVSLDYGVAGSADAGTPPLHRAGVAVFADAEIERVRIEISAMVRTLTADSRTLFALADAPPQQGRLTDETSAWLLGEGLRARAFVPYRLGAVDLTPQVAVAIVSESERYRGLSGSISETSAQAAAALDVDLAAVRSHRASLRFGAFAAIGSSTSWTSRDRVADTDSSDDWQRLFAGAWSLPVQRAAKGPDWHAIADIIGRVWWAGGHLHVRSGAAFADDQQRWFVTARTVAGALSLQAESGGDFDATPDMLSARFSAHLERRLSIDGGALLRGDTRQVVPTRSLLGLAAAHPQSMLDGSSLWAQVSAGERPLRASVAAAWAPNAQDYYISARLDAYFARRGVTLGLSGYRMLLTSAAGVFATVATGPNPGPGLPPAGGTRGGGAISDPPLW